ncbi:acyltransferase [Microbacterium gubbeenense]|uniref:acyltransferase n=1 Tax=Microbacterium gubbeenense TaxID=159896 RepID=UPI0009FFD817|nr:acyltransferase [Microbacterium gubbeenense]
MLKTAVGRVFTRFRRMALGNERFARCSGVEIGTGCRILSNIVTTEPWLVSIGDRVTISSEVSFVTHDGSGWLYRDDRGRRFRYAPIRIGNHVFIGTRATIMPGVSVGDNVVIGAGSLVTKSVPSGTVVAGVPARKIAPWEDYMAKVADWPASNDKKGNTYREQVDSIAGSYRP